MSRLARRRLRRISSLLFILIIIPVVMFSIKMLLPAPPPVTGEIISPLASNTSRVTVEEEASSVIDNGSLEKAVQGALVGTSGSYGVAIENLKTGETYY